MTPKRNGKLSSSSHGLKMINTYLMVIACYKENNSNYNAIYVK